MEMRVYVMLQFDEYKVKLNNLRPELEDLDQALGLEAAQREGAAREEEERRQMEESGGRLEKGEPLDENRLTVYIHSKEGYSPAQSKPMVKRAVGTGPRGAPFRCASTRGVELLGARRPHRRRSTGKSGGPFASSALRDCPSFAPLALVPFHPERLFVPRQDRGSWALERQAKRPAPCNRGGPLFLAQLCAIPSGRLRR